MPRLSVLFVFAAFSLACVAVSCAGLSVAKLASEVSGALEAHTEAAALVSSAESVAAVESVAATSSFEIYKSSKCTGKPMFTGTGVSKCITAPVSYMPGSYMMTDCVNGQNCKTTIGRGFQLTCPSAANNQYAELILSSDARNCDGYNTAYQSTRFTRTLIRGKGAKNGKSCEPVVYSEPGQRAYTLYYAKFKCV